MHCETFYISSSCLLLSGFTYKHLFLAIGKLRIHYVLRKNIMNYLLICTWLRCFDSICGFAIVIIARFITTKPGDLE